jgi:hypothetical protein
VHRSDRRFPALAAAALVAAWVTAAGAPPPARGEDAPSAIEEARRENIERLEKDVRRLATSPWAAQKKDEIRKAVAALGDLGGPAAAKATLGALALDDDVVEQDVMKVVERDHSKTLVAPLSALLEGKDTRRRFRLHARIAHALSVVADEKAIEPLAELVRSEDAQVVAAAADALATFRTAPHAKRVEPVKRLIDRFETTWNYKESIRPEDRIRREEARADWEVFGQAVRKALQALTGQAQLTRPKQFRDWWNENKKATNW